MMQSYNKIEQDVQKAMSEIIFNILVHALKILNFCTYCLYLTFLNFLVLKSLISLFKLISL